MNLSFSDLFGKAVACLGAFAGTRRYLIVIFVLIQVCSSTSCGSWLSVAKQRSCSSVAICSADAACFDAEESVVCVGVHGRIHTSSRISGFLVVLFFLFFVTIFEARFFTCFSCIASHCKLDLLQRWGSSSQHFGCDGACFACCSWFGFCCLCGLFFNVFKTREQHAGSCSRFAFMASRFANPNGFFCVECGVRSDQDGSCPNKVYDWCETFPRF